MAKKNAKKKPSKREFDALQVGNRIRYYKRSDGWVQLEETETGTVETTNWQGKPHSFVTVQHWRNRFGRTVPFADYVGKVR